MEHKDSIFISWENVSAMITKQLYIILWETHPCQAEWHHDNYWSTKLLNYHLSLQEAAKICDAVHANFDTRVTAFPDEDQYCSSLSMELSMCILETYLNRKYEKCFFDNDGIILVNPEMDSQLKSEENNLRFGNVKVNPALLKSSTELKEYFTEWGATFTSLIDFCEEYQDKFGNQLYWHFPHSNDKHSGLYFIICSDGILCLPYDEMDGEYFESFKMEDARFLDRDSIGIFIDDWMRFSDDLIDALLAMQKWLNR